MTNREAINLLEEVRVLDDSIYAYNKAYSDALEMALTALEAEEAWYDTHEYPHKEQWIPVTERLPNEEEYIQCNGLFIVSDGNRAYAEYFDIYDKKCFGEHTMHGFRADMAVTAWMPLPKPWEGGEA